MSEQLALGGLPAAIALGCCFVAFPSLSGHDINLAILARALLDLFARVLKDCSVSAVVWSFPCSYHCRESLAVYRLR